MSQVTSEASNQGRTNNPSEATHSPGAESILGQNFQVFDWNLLSGSGLIFAEQSNLQRDLWSFSQRS